MERFNLISMMNIRFFLKVYRPGGRHLANYNPTIVYLTRENLAESYPVIIPCKVLYRRSITMYGMITGSLSAYFSRARCSLLEIGIIV